MYSETQPASDDFYSQVLARIERIMIVLGVASVATAWAYFGWRIGAGLGLGAAVAYFNFYWLKRVVAGLAEHITQSAPSETSRAIVRRFLLRYFLMAIVAFVILSVSRESLYGLLAGLFLPVAAILCEAAHEVYKTVVRGQ